MDLTSNDIDDDESSSLDSDSSSDMFVAFLFRVFLEHFGSVLAGCNDDEADADSMSSRSTGHPDSDEEPEDDKDEDGFTSACVLNWRMSPSRSHSDWALEIVHASSSNNNSSNSNNNAAVATYHVHRNVLTVGPYRSRTMAQLEFGVTTTDQHTTVFGTTTTVAAPHPAPTTYCSRFVLPHAAAKFFPVFLDFVYAKALVGYHLSEGYQPNPSLLFTSDTAFPLWYLADFFDVPLLRRRARAYAKQDMVGDWDTISKNCRVAIALGHEGMLQLVEDAVAKGLATIPASVSSFPLLAQALDLDLLQRVATSDYLLAQCSDTSSGRLKTNALCDSQLDKARTWKRQEPSHVFLSTPVCTSWALSKLIACFCEHHTFTAEEFMSLTSEELLPYISPDVSTILMEIEAGIFAEVSQPNPHSIRGRCQPPHPTNESP